MADPPPSDLTDSERGLLVQGLREWSGPATPTADIARLIGFASVRDLQEQGRALALRIQRREPLEAADWRRALLATEIVFASDVIGSGIDWTSTTGLSDNDSIDLLRACQRKLAGISRRP